MTKRNILLFCLLSCALVVAKEEPCEPPTHPPTGLSVKEGFVEFMPKSELQPYLDGLPQVANDEVQSALSSSNTMWYDENSMVFLYQDSIEVVTGARANCVGRKIGERNKNNPPIAKLLNYFGEDYRFMFPFRKAAGTDEVENSHVINFWVPPRQNGKVLPVKWWKMSSRGRWRWTFPVGTLFGEILFEKGHDGKLYAFEIRTRKRYLDGWEVAVYRPYETAEKLAEAITKIQPGWAMSLNLRTVVNHLRSKDTLVPYTLESKAYGKVFPAIQGALDTIPEIDDKNLVARLLTYHPFVSVEGKIWKENQTLQTYAPATKADFHIAPKGYQMGMIPVNEVSCNRCHSETGRRLSHFEFDIILYGEVWGEDQIFTWHLFEPHRFIYDAWDDADGSRKINSRMVTAGLVKNEKPSGGDSIYKPLPTVFEPDRRTVKGH